MKVAGSSIEVALTPHCGLEDILTGTSYIEELGPGSLSYLSQNNLGVVEMNWVSVKNNITMEPIFSSHITPGELEERYKGWGKVKDYLKFSIVRNPWDVLVSYFWWSFYGYTVIGEKPNKGAHESIKPMIYDSPVVLRAKLQNFCESCLDFNEADVGLKKENDNVLEWFVRVQQSFFLNKDIKFILRFENIQNDFNKVCSEIDVPCVPIPRLKSAIRKSDLHYQDYYNDYVRELVGDCFKETIERFDYKF